MTTTTIELINSSDVWENIVNYMDDEIREKVHAEIAPCSNREFLLDYCERDEDFINVLLTEFSISILDLDFDCMSLFELENLTGLTFSYDELSEIEELQRVMSVENCGTSGRYPEKTWWDVTLYNGEHIDVYTAGY